MTTRQTFRLAASTLLLSLAVSVSHAATETDDADRIAKLKDEAAQLREQAESRYQAIEPECHKRFLVNSCIDAAKQERLDTIRKARALESEARKLDLAQRQRIAAEAMRENPGAPQRASAPAGDAVIRPQPEAERLRRERERDASIAQREEQANRAAKDAERASERSKAAEAAAQRAEQAARERARYEERIREYEEKKARDAAGR